MMATITNLLRIRSGEVRLAALVGTLFALVELGRSAGGSAADTLFFLRFGVNNLPSMYIALGILNFIALLCYAAFLGRGSKDRFFTLLFVAFVVILLAERLAIQFNVRALYPLLWLSVNIIGLLLGTVVWSAAGEICDARQAKRLFPLFVSAGILGSLVGSLLIGTIARLFGTENLLVLDAALLFAGMFVLRTITHRFFPSVRRGLSQSNFVTDVRAGFDFVRRSPMLQLLAISAVLFSVLYFSVSFPFGKAVTAAFPHEADLAGFLGLFSGIASAATFMVSLLVANRLYARIGIVNALLLLPLMYLLGFIAMAANFALPTAGAARFSQWVILGGVGDGAYSAVFNVVPPEKRAQVRAFDAGVPAQLGIALSGVLLILGTQVLTSLQIFLMGMIVAMLCIAVVWGMKQRYAEALIAALRAGRYEVFTQGEGALQGFQRDAGATAVVVKALHDVKPETRRLAAEMLGRMGATSSASALIASLDDPDVETRAAAVQALGTLKVRAATDSVMRLLADPQPVVRAAVLDTLMKWHPLVSTNLIASLEVLLQEDEPALQARAAGVLVALGQPTRALPALAALLRHVRPPVRALAVMVMGQVASDESGAEPIIAMLQDESPEVRRAACNALGQNRQAQSIEALIICLEDPDTTVRAAASSALRQHKSATPRLLLVLQEGRGIAQDAALAALVPNGLEQTAVLRAYAERQMEALADTRRLAKAIPRSGPGTKLLYEALEAQSRSYEQHVVKVFGLLGNSEKMELVGKSLKTPDAQMHAAAVEALETLGDRQLAKKVVPLLDNVPVEQSAVPDTTTKGATIRQLLASNDSWMCALAACVAGELAMHEALPQLHALTKHPHPLIQAAVEDALHLLGARGTMKTLQTISLMERILLLHQVPMLAELLPDDLKQIADIAHERLYPDEALVCREGEQGNELFIIVGGKVQVIKNNGDTEKLLAVRETGEFFGEMAIIEAAPRFATVRAEGEVRVLCIDGDAFKTILHDRPEVSLGVIRSLSRRLREQG